MKSCTPEQILDRCLAGWSVDVGGGELSADAPTHAVLVAALVRREKDRKCWIIVRDLRHQEAIHGELVEWIPSARLLPPVPGKNEAGLEDPETVAERLSVLSRDLNSSAPIVIASTQLDSRVPRPDALRTQSLTAEVGQEIAMDDFCGKLVGAGYERAEVVGTRGQYARRGGLVDVFSFDSPDPVRIEFDDIEIASMRTFDPNSQLARCLISSTSISPDGSATDRLPVSDLLRENDRMICVGGEWIPGSIEVGGDGRESGFAALPFGSLHAGDLVFDEHRRNELFRQLEEWRKKDWFVVLAAGSKGEAARFGEMAEEMGQRTSWVHFLPLPVSSGFVHSFSRTVVLAEAELLGRSATLRAQRVARRRFHFASTRERSDFTSFDVGEFVVHLEHGIGIFEGHTEPEQGEESLILRYADDARLFVPLSGAWQVSRYAGLGKAKPRLSRLGSDQWSKAKARTVRSVFDYAARMLSLHAERQTMKGFSCPKDTAWQEEFEGSFPFEETRDQIRAIAETKAGMESPLPMDRLICGDVGFGKTEVAIRAAFKMVMAGQQVALLAPTTVLTQQHYDTLRTRMSDFPMRIEVLNRYVSTSKTRDILRALREGSVDILVGTHRILSGDVTFHSLGLVIIDEEQRFGVKHKESLKERFRQVDLLTLSATPIPRTLYLALAGARDMSLLETPPSNRQPVETIVCAYDERTIRDAIRREVERGGQVYFLHNRIHSIRRLADRVRDLIPGLRVAVGHGQMHEGELDAVMRSFVGGEVDVLVSTTIIESGLDIPNANTIIIDRADRFGLADLYQLRGRVGRAGAKAYAYLLLNRDMLGGARKRVSAIQQYSALGSGFRIAMRDLELRGAGNLLGTAQSGHILAVGFDLYCKMLRRAVDTLHGKKKFTRTDCPVRIDFVETSGTNRSEPGQIPAFLPSAYITETSIRIQCHRRLAEAENRAEVDAVEAEWRDRFGPIPAPAQALITLARIGVAGVGAHLSSVEVSDGKVRCRRGNEYVQRDGKFPRLTSGTPDSRLREILQIVESLSAS